MDGSSFDASATKTRQEAVVLGSGLDWTLVRPAALTDGPAKGLEAVRVLIDLTGVQAGFISCADVAAFCLREMTDGRYRQQAPVITDWLCLIHVIVGGVPVFIVGVPIGSA